MLQILITFLGKEKKNAFCTSVIHYTHNGREFPGLLEALQNKDQDAYTINYLFISYTIYI